MLLSASTASLRWDFRFASLDAAGKTIALLGWTLSPPLRLCNRILFERRSGGSLGASRFRLAGNAG